MRICIDLDGTICDTRVEGQHYKYVQPKDGAVDFIKKLRADGHYIIIDTARHMATCDHNVGQVLAKQGKTLFDWLYMHEIPYDEIHLGKPLADVYIDDKALKFENWKQIDINNKK